jgi:hypothetical protein
MNDRTDDDRTDDDRTPGARTTHGQPAASRSLDFTPSELELVRTALRLLESTLGHEEADELEDVQSLLARLPSPERR